MAARELKLYNSLSRKVETLPLPAPGKPFGFYLCGPTVYGRAHIGNFRTMVCADLLVRILKAFGYPLKFIRNITDVDDKTIKGAQAEKLPLPEFTRRHIESFQADCMALALTSPDLEPRATGHIGEMIALIERLMKSGHAYRAEDGSIYYRVDSFKNYGCLSHLDRAGLRAGARVVQDEYEKEAVADFALWKSHRPEDGLVQWESPWGAGRPGWHLECSAMSMKYLGETYDLHGGGVDLLFPHHENEIAQSEAATGKPFVRHWWHVAHLLVDGRKMSKSLGNLYTLDDIAAKGFTPRELRYLLLSAHYRDNLNFTWEGLEAAREALSRLDNFSERLDRLGMNRVPNRKLPNLQTRFQECLSEDLNISGGLGELFTSVRAVNAAIDRNELSAEDAATWRLTLQNLDEVLDISLGYVTSAEGLDYEQAQTIAQNRETARKNKQWAEADRLREELIKLGYDVKDTPSGPLLSRRR